MEGKKALNWHPADHIWQKSITVSGFGKRHQNSTQSEVFQTLCPILLCKAHAGKDLFLINIFNKHKVQKTKCMQTMGVQCVTSSFCA